MEVYSPRAYASAKKTYANAVPWSPAQPGLDVNPITNQTLENHQLNKPMFSFIRTKAFLWWPPAEALAKAAPVFLIISLYYPELHSCFRGPLARESFWYRNLTWLDLVKKDTNILIATGLLIDPQTGFCIRLKRVVIISKAVSRRGSGTGSHFDHRRAHD